MKIFVFIRSMHTYKFENELLGLKYYDGLVGYFHRECGLCLTNLTTKECIALEGDCDYFEICFDPASTKYNVLGWTEYQGTDTCDFEILTLDEDLSLRAVKNTLGIKGLSDCDTTTVYGKLFWTLPDKRILSFNSTNEKFKVIGFPDELNLEVCCYTFFEFEGSLCLVEQPQLEAPVFNLWILKDADTSNHWTMIKGNITLPIEGTSLHDYYLSIGSHWTLVESHFSSQSGEIIIAPRTLDDDDDDELTYVDTYVYFYGFLSGQFKSRKIRRLPFKNIKVKKFVKNDVRLLDFM